MTSAQPTTSSEAELERIRAEYRRRSREVPADLYGWQHPVNRFWHLHLYRHVLAALKSTGVFPLDSRSILDVGCGDGLWLQAFLNWGASADRVCGIDLSPERIETAKSRLPHVDLRLGNAGRLPYPDQSFDIVSTFVVFSSILDPELRRSVAADMRRVLKPAGVILWYDFFWNNPRNPNVRGVKADEVRSLLPDCNVTLEKITLAPPLARRIVPLSWSAASLLNRLPILRTHYFGVIQPLGTR